MFRTEFFFFKQKTAYEMRISDWSSDVCSSDLLCRHRRRRGADRARIDRARRILCSLHPAKRGLKMEASARAEIAVETLHEHGISFGEAVRSEEHTSELQSLMRISYAVFCLQKKKQTRHKLNMYDNITKTRIE